MNGVTSAGQRATNASHACRQCSATSVPDSVDSPFASAAHLRMSGTTRGRCAPSRKPDARPTALTAWMYVVSMESPPLGAHAPICSIRWSTIPTYSASGSEPHRAPTLVTARLRTAARCEASSGRSLARMLARSLLTSEGKCVSTSCRISRQQIVTSIDDEPIPSSRRGVRPCTVVPAADCGTSARTVLRPMLLMSRSSSLPFFTI
mmetsp:Transcript_537/g.1385  ORF Transcript_537/g.1385 Transcript_537/m.1385 type:complete len:206 (+) Transcript_537:886-1503(+)